MDLIDERDDHTDEDRENVTAATDALEALRAKLAPAIDELLHFKAEAEQVDQRIQRKANFSPAAAEEVMRLFPKERFLSVIEASADETELRDISQFCRIT